MKKLIILFGLLVLAGGVCSAQTKGYTASIWSQGESFSLNGHKEFKAVSLAIAPGWSFNSSIFARLHCDMSIGMWDRGGDNKTFRVNGALGPSFGWNIMKDNGTGIIDLIATAAISLNKEDWRYHYYDLGASWALPSQDKSKYVTRWFMGFGVRYYDSHTVRFDNQFNLYAKIGFRFN